MAIEVRIEGCPSVNLNSRLNHFAKAKHMKDWATTAFYKFRKHKPKKPFTKAKIKIVRYFSGRNKFRDYDNLVACMKPVIDGIVWAKIIEDDSYQVTGQWDVSQVRLEVGDYLIVSVEGLE